MLARSILLLSALLLPAVGLAQIEDSDEGWELLYEKDDIKGYRKNSEDSRFHAWKGEGIIDAELHRVVAVYMDSSRSCDWLSDCVENRYIEKPDLSHQTGYNRTNLPWPFKDRDLVFSEEYSFDSDSRSITARMWSVERSDMPPVDDAVRARILLSTFYAQQIDDKRTRVKLSIQLEPMGRLPAWLGNSFSRSWPKNTFAELRAQVYSGEGYSELADELRRAYPLPEP